MIEKKKLNKFIKRLDVLITELGRRKETAVLQTANETYYKQMRTELKRLLEQFEETEKKLKKISSILNEEYVVTFRRWRADIRWLSANLPEQHTKAIL